MAGSASSPTKAGERFVITVDTVPVGNADQLGLALPKEEMAPADTWITDELIGASAPRSTARPCRAPRQSKPATLISKSAMVANRAAQDERARFRLERTGDHLQREERRRRRNSQPAQPWKHSNAILWSRRRVTSRLFSSSDFLIVYMEHAAVAYVGKITGQPRVNAPVAPPASPWGALYMVYVAANRGQLATRRTRQ